MDYKNIIINNNIIINKYKNEFADVDTINIVGKGETAQYLPDAFGVNQGIIFTNGRFLFINDFESLFGIEHLLCNVECIFCPDYPHYNTKPLKDQPYTYLINYARTFGFNGDVFIYKIKTSFSNELNDFELTTGCGSDIPIDIASRFLNIKNLNLYGIGVTSYYHPDIINLDYTISKSNKYFNNWYNIITNFRRGSTSHNYFKNTIQKRIDKNIIKSITYN